MDQLEEYRNEYEELTNQLANPELISQWEKFQEISKRRAKLEKIIKKQEEIGILQHQIEENEYLLLTEEDTELTAIANQELIALKEREYTAREELEKMLAGDKETPEAIIMEVRPGTGGEEASLFARELWNMYSKYAETKGWDVEILHTSETELGGIREVAFEIEGEEAFDRLQYEGGVHRVQRIPETEKMGRIHTSTVSVAVLPKPKETQFTINPSDVKIEFTNSSGPGGQNVNKRQTAVRLTHTPTGLVIFSDTSRTQQANREAAMGLLRAKLFEQQQRESQQQLSQQRKSQIGASERAEKIRTYNFPQDRITEHRIKKSWHGIDKIVHEGNLDPIVEALQNSEIQ